MSKKLPMNDKFQDHCAVVGVIGPSESANFCYLGLYAMQHRGQEGAGISATDGSHLLSHKGMGLVADVFNENILESLKGNRAIGHARYATCGNKDAENLQPLVANFADSFLAVAHNGNLVNAQALRYSLEQAGAIFSTTSDTEVILHLVARASSERTLVDKLVHALKQVQGAYSLTILSPDRLIAARDPYGVRPLSLGRIDKGYVVASETCAFDLIDAEFIRDIEPGEILEIPVTGELKSDLRLRNGEQAFCVFELIYFARPDSVIDGVSVYEARKLLGAELAREQPAEADLVIPVPDSGVPAALGYAQEIKLPMEFGLIRNHYIGRTFIEPKQSIRDFGVKLKLNANSSMLNNARVVVVDDSIVRGTTCRKIVTMLRKAGVKEVHFRISSPPTTGPCYYGIDTPSKEELIAARHSQEEIRVFIGADSLGYLSQEGLFRAIGLNRSRFCDACFSGKYRLGVPEDKNFSAKWIKTPVTAD